MEQSLLTHQENKTVDIPWQNRPAGDDAVMWRYGNNPIVTKENVAISNSIFNSAVVRYRDGFAGVFRCDDRGVRMNIHTGFSKDGINWDIEPNPINMIAGNTEYLHSDYKYDPRVTLIEDKYWVTWCNGHYGPTIGMAYTYDFASYYMCENAFLPFNRNGVLFPKKINDKYAMLSRPSDNGHTAFGDIFVSYSPDMKYWGEHRSVLTVSPFEESAWQSTKVGAGGVPVWTDDGWLIIYHGVINTCNGFRYSAGGAILDHDDPSIVKYKSREYLLAPDELYERVGDVPNVIFPCATLEQDGEKLTMYYGAADTSVCLAFGYISEIVDFIKKHNF